MLTSTIEINRTATVTPTGRCRECNFLGTYGVFGNFDGTTFIEVCDECAFKYDDNRTWLRVTCSRCELSDAVVLEVLAGELLAHCSDCRS
jgi:hypothetical protein